MKLPNFTFMEDVNKRLRNFILFLNLNMFLKNSTSATIVYIWQSKWAGIIAIKTKRTQIRFWSDVFAAVASSDKVKFLMTELRRVLSGKPVEMLIDVSFTSQRNDTYLLTLQVNWDKGETQLQRDHSWIFCLFARKPGKSVDQSKHAIYKSSIWKPKQKIALRRGWEWAFEQTTFK